MAKEFFDLPEAVRMRAASMGETGAEWLAKLPDSVRTLENLWSVQVVEILPGGSESLVAKVRQSDGSQAALKIGLPGSADLAAEARVYQKAGGSGYARVYAHNQNENALLMECLGLPLAHANISIEAQIRCICATLGEAWVSLDEPDGFLTGAGKARWLADFISEQWPRLGNPCSGKALELALLYALQRERAYSPETSVLVHGDAHSHNLLRVIREKPADSPSYKFVDPDGMFAEKACDLAVPMREWNRELLEGDTVKLASARCELLSSLTQTDYSAIWQWGYVERMSTGLVLLQIGMEKEGSDYLAVADRLA